MFVEYTKPDTAKANVLAALKRGAHVVIGTSGLTEEDYAEIDAARTTKRARRSGGRQLRPDRGAAAEVRRDGGQGDSAVGDHRLRARRKVDAPSGTARELATRLSRVRRPEPTVPIEQTVGEREARGATLSGTQVHSVRLPGFVISAEVIFGLPDQRLSIRHDSGSSARPYVDGALIAIRRVSTLVGVHRGLDAVLDL